MLCSASGALCASTIMTIVSIDVILPSRALLFHFLDTGHLMYHLCVHPHSATLVATFVAGGSRERRRATRSGRICGYGSGPSGESGQVAV